MIYHSDIRIVNLTMKVQNTRDLKSQITELSRRQRYLKRFKRGSKNDEQSCIDGLISQNRAALSRLNVLLALLNKSNFLHSRLRDEADRWSLRSNECDSMARKIWGKPEDSEAASEFLNGLK